jgi:hypothetical protein
MTLSTFNSLNVENSMLAKSKYAMSLRESTRPLLHKPSPTFTVVIPSRITSDGREAHVQAVKDGKEWQAFFKISKDDFERECKLPKRDSHSLASSLKHRSSATVTSGKSPRPQDQEDGGYSLSIISSHPASMKRVKSDQVVYNQPGSFSSAAQDASVRPFCLHDISSLPIQEMSPPSEQFTPSIPLSPPIEKLPSVGSQNLLEAELGLSPTDTNAINRLIRNLEDKEPTHLAEATPSVTLHLNRFSPLLRG